MMQPKKYNRGHNHQHDFIMPTRRRLLGSEDINCRLVLLVREFFHRGNTAIPPILPAANRSIAPESSSRLP